MTDNPNSSGQKPIVLVIDDERSVLIMFEQLLQQEGFTPLLAENGQQGIELLNQEQPHVVLIDKNLPDMSGDIQFAEFLLEKAEVAVVPGSAFGAPGHVRLSFACSLETLEKAIGRIRKALT